MSLVNDNEHVIYMFKGIDILIDIFSDCQRIKLHVFKLFSLIPIFLLLLSVGVSELI